MTFEEFAQVCRNKFGAAARELSDVALREGVSERDNAAAKIALLIDLAALLWVNQRCEKQAFVDICAEAFDDAEVDIAGVSKCQ